MKRNFTLFLVLVFSVSTHLFGQLKSVSTASAYSGCPPLVVNFTDLSTGNPGSYEWDFDNGNAVSTLKNPTTSYPSPGVYNIRHVVFNGPNSDTEYILIRVFQPPKVEFGAPDNKGCIMPCHTVHLSNMTVPGESPVDLYVWDFGDGSQPVQIYDAQHCYDSVGNFDVTLVARDQNGCQVSKIQQGYVSIGRQPTAHMTAAPVKSCVQPIIVNFQGSGSSQNQPLSYMWYFGNGVNGGTGSTSALQNPSAIYYNGIYKPVLIVSDALGCQATDTGLVEVTDITAGFTVTNVNACQNIPMQFTDTSNFAQRWIWDFGDGTAKDTTKNPSHTYTTTGTKTVTLIVFYNNCSDTIVRTNYISVTPPFNFTFSGGPLTGSCTAPLTVNFTSTPAGGSSYQWNFGDNSPADNTANPSHTYTANGTYDVTLSVGNAQGCINTQTLPKYISIADIHAAFTVDTPQGCTPRVVKFTDASTSNPAITSYTWDFGDNTSLLTCNCPNPSHTYNTQGTFVAKVTIRNATGCVDSAKSEIIKVGQRLYPLFVADPLIQCVDQPVAFKNLTLGTTDSTTYLWDFGDGTSTKKEPTHEYSDTGTYTVSLRVTNQGCSTDSVKLKYVKIIVPKADFLFATNCANAVNVTFYDSVSKGAETWLWDFGDGSPPVTGRNPTHTYPQTGPYKVTLTVSNLTTGCVDSTTKPIIVGNAQAGFKADTLAACVGSTIFIRDTSLGSTSWSWKIYHGDKFLFYTPNKNASFQFPDTGRYTITLVVTTAGGCRDSIGKVNYITIYGVKPVMIPSPKIGCAPFKVNFSDASTVFMGTAVNWKWRFGTSKGDSSTINSPTTSFTYDSSGVLYPSLRVTDSHGCSATVIDTIKTTKPTANFKSDTAICPGEPVRFTNTSVNGSTYLWYFGDNQSSTDTNPVHTYINPGHYTVMLIAKNALTGCPDTIRKQNYLNVDSPVVDFYVNSSFLSCPPFPVQFYNVTTRPGLRYNWYFGDNGVANNVSPLHVYFFPGEYDVTAVATDSSGCSVSKTYPKLITVGGPKGHFVATPDSGCVPLTVSITGTADPNVSIVADLGDGPPFYDTINLVHTYRTPGNYFPVYTLTDSVNCIVAYPVDTIVVGLIPYPNLPDDTTICKGNYVQFNLPYGDYFQWTSNPSPTFLTCDTCKSTLSKATDTLTYYVTAITNIGCVARDTITLNVDALPQVLPGLSFTLCSSDTLQLSAGGNSSTAIWTPNQYISDTNSLNPQVWPPVNTIYRVTAANSAGCTISRIVKVLHIDSIYGGTGFDDTLLCEGNPIQLKANVLSASVIDTAYKWIPARYLNSSGSSNPIFSPPPGPGEYDYQVIITSGRCTPDTNKIHISVHSKPPLESGDNITVAEGTPSQVWANSTDDSVSYFWVSGYDSLSCDTCRRPDFIATRTELMYITVSTQYGCKTSDSVLITVVACDDKMVFVPNTFTPNNDGNNDRLFVRGSGLRVLNYFRIYDRWGTLVWETHNSEEGWDGIIGGKLADVATYVYTLKGTCSSGATVEKSGNVTLIR